MHLRVLPMTCKTLAAMLLVLALSAVGSAQTGGTEAQQVERVRALYEAAKAREAAGDWAGPSVRGRRSSDSRRRTRARG